MPQTRFELSPSIAVIIAGVIIAGAIIFVGTTPTPPTTPGNDDIKTQANVSQPSEEDHIIGSPSAPIVLIEYSDFQCPYCQMIHPTLKRIVEESNGEVAWVYRHFPLESIHPEARSAAVASECIAAQVGNTGFWGFADAVFNDQGELGAAAYTRIATSLGANAEQFNACLSSNTHDARVDEDMAEAQLNGGSGTPYTIVYGKGVQVPLNGALPYEQIKAVINAVKERQ